MNDVSLPRTGSGKAVAITPPMAMLAEVTHRCPLSCVYCSNPLELHKANEELSTEIWLDVFRQAAELGVLHLHLSGGEPASRRDLVELTKGATDAGLYTNLITSGVGLTEKRVAALADAGLEHVQLSIQGATAAMAERIGGYAGAFERKMAVAEWVRAAQLPLTVNAVCHRLNMESLPDMVDMAVRLGAQRIEIANVQFHGWASLNQDALLPTFEQVEYARLFVAEARERLKGTLVIDFVPSDYYASRPKACMGGWGKVGLNVTPTGKVLPCHAAETIKTLDFDNVRTKSLSDIWYLGSAFNAYRGDDWMQEPCRSCVRKDIDFGGCRCQALALAGDAAATDPVCGLSPMRSVVDRLITPKELPGPVKLTYRGEPV